MKKSMVMTLIGKDRPGLVGSVAAIVDDHGGNWEESRMVQVAGEFAGVLHVQVPEERAGELEQALSGLRGMSVTVASTSGGEPAAEDMYSIELEVVGQDHPGIVHHLARAIAARGISVDELESEVTSAPMSGERLFHARAVLQAPKSVTRRQLEADLEQLAADLMVDVEFGEV